MFGQPGLLLTPPIPSKYLKAIEGLINDLEQLSIPLNRSIELRDVGDVELQNSASEYSRESVAPSKKLTENGSAQYHFLVFSAATLGAIVYWFGAEQAIQRYAFGSLDFFKWNAPISVLLTNVFFNERAYLDLLNDTTELTPAQRIVALIAGIATVAPFFFVGFVGELWQKILVSISTIFDFPVFYYGALDFYQYFHAAFVQQFRWLARCSPEKFRIASQKAHLIHHLKAQHDYFVYATKQERATFMSEFHKTVINQKLTFLINKNQLVTMDNSYLTWARWLLCEGSGLWGVAVMMQDIGHVAIVISGVLSIQNMPFWAQVLLILILAPGNLIPNMGYSFATMANFDFIDFLRVTFFVKVPQVQRVIADQSKTTNLLLCLTLIVLRYLYITSGFSNDEVNYQGALFLGANEAAAEYAGLNGNLAMALIYNGVLCEKLFKTFMLWIAQKMGDHEDIRQIEFEKFYSKLLVKMMVMPVSEIKNMEKETEFVLTYANYFTSKKDTTLSSTKNALLVRDCSK